MELIFLGTGPTGGIKDHGQSKRLESSVVLETPQVFVLIDVTRDFNKQTKMLPKTLDAILITHAHKDAIGGMNQLVSWMDKRSIANIKLFSHPLTIKKIRERFQKLNPLILNAIESGHKFEIGNVIVTPFLVEHSIQPGFPTLGFHFSLGSNSLVYVSDVASWGKKAEKLMRNADILVVDGAMWDKKMIAHLDIKEILPKICSWPVKKIIFTQIGHTAPKHEILQQKIKKICPKAQPAFDGMRVQL